MSGEFTIVIMPMRIARPTASPWRQESCDEHLAQFYRLTINCEHVGDYPTRGEAVRAAEKHMAQASA